VGRVGARRAANKLRHPLRVPEPFLSDFVAAARLNLANQRSAAVFPAVAAAVTSLST
jgi:hypothetical protein